MVEHRVDFFVNTVHSAQNQKIEQLSNDVQKVMENFIDPTTIMQIECPEMYHPIVEELKKVPADGV